MPEAILDQLQIIPTIGQGEAVGMPQHMRVDRAETRAFSGCTDDVIHRLPGQRLCAGEGASGPRGLRPVVARPARQTTRVLDTTMGELTTRHLDLHLSR